MNTSLLALADHLSDEDLLARLDALAGRERSTAVEMVAHLASLESRPSVYAAKGFGSLFAYCTEALHLSEDAAGNRIEVAKACRRFPVILGLLGSGTMTLTSVRLLGPHLSPENHEAVLERAKGRTCAEIKVLVAELAPRPDTRTSIRRVPTAPTAPTVSADPAQGARTTHDGPVMHPTPLMTMTDATSVATPPIGSPIASDQPAVLRPTERSTVEPTAPGRYRVRFTMDEEMHTRLRRVQTLLRREVPGGDARELFDRALKLLEAQVERAKLGRPAKPSTRRPIRFETDKPPAKRSRYIPDRVKDGVERRDGGRCAFVAPDGRRCTERAFLEFHHQVAYAKGGEATIDNISLRCRRHNQYEAERVFGARGDRRGWDQSQVTKDSIRTPPPGP